MGSVTEIDDGLTYIFDDGNKNIVAVQWLKNNQFVHFELDGQVGALIKTDGSGIQRHELKQLMIMWLALNYPDCLKYDEVDKEEHIRKYTESKDFDPAE